MGPFTFVEGLREFGGDRWKVERIWGGVWGEPLESERRGRERW